MYTSSPRTANPALLLAVLFCAAVPAACAHAVPPEAAAPAAQPTAAPAQLVASRKSATPVPVNDTASGQSELDAALQQLRSVTVFFHFDDATLTREAEERLAVIGDLLRKHPQLSLRVEGNCDERGSEAYNLALGQRRAEAARRYLVQMGAQQGQIAALSLGSEKPKALGHDETAWSQNRRDDLVAR